MNEAIGYLVYCGRPSSGDLVIGPFVRESVPELAVSWADLSGGVAGGAGQGPSAEAGVGLSVAVFAFVQFGVALVALRHDVSLVSGVRVHCPVPAVPPRHGRYWAPVDHCKGRGCVATGTNRYQRSVWAPAEQVT